jgi:hypothetical protein
MSERDFAIQLATLAEAFGEQKLTPVRIEAYHRGLQDVPIPLLTQVVDRLIQTVGSESFRWTALPAVADIRQAAETIRREELRRHPYQGCLECDQQKGWIEVKDDHGVLRARRCRCWQGHQEKLERLGLSAKPIAQIEAAGEELEPPSLPAPTVEALPASVQPKVRELARSKVMR